MRSRHINPFSVLDWVRHDAMLHAGVCLLGVIGFLCAFGCPPPGGNHPPVGNAGEDANVAVGAQATLDGSGSADPDGDALTYAWSQVGGPQDVTVTAESSLPIHQRRWRIGGRSLGRFCSCPVPLFMVWIGTSSYAEEVAGVLSSFVRGHGSSPRSGRNLTSDEKIPDTLSAVCCRIHMSKPSIFQRYMRTLFGHREASSPRLPAAANRARRVPIQDTLKVEMMGTR
jgi:hypothetical protein